MRCVLCGVCMVWRCVLCGVEVCGVRCVIECYHGMCMCVYCDVVCGVIGLQ